MKGHWARCLGLAGFIWMVGLAVGCSDDAQGASDRDAMAKVEDAGADTAASEPPLDPFAEADDGTPEEETIADYRVPQSSGRYVFIADAAHNSVIVVDSETLAVKAVDVGLRPTHLVPLGQDNAAAVINVMSDDVTIIRMGTSGDATTQDVDVRSGTNALRVAEDGSFVVAFYDPLFSGESGIAGTDQEISIIDTTEGAVEVYDLTVGMHPSDIVFNETITEAFVITDDGINAVDLTDLENIGIPPLYKLFDTNIVDPDTLEYVIVPDGSVAIGRQEGSTEVVFGWLDSTQDVRPVTLDAVPTDLEVAHNGSFGLFVLRSTSQVAFVDLPLAAGQDPVPQYESLGGAVCGLATIAPSNTEILLHTSTGGGELDQRKVTYLVEDTGVWSVDTVLTERAVERIEVSPDSVSAVVYHKELGVQPVGQYPFAYTLVTLPELQKKLQQIPVKPLQTLLLPSGDLGFVLLGDYEFEIKQVDVIDLNSFIVDTIDLGSTPTAIGFAPTTDRVFIAQDHLAGRMSFVDVADLSVKTVTGYILNDEITN